MAEYDLTQRWLERLLHIRLFCLQQNQTDGVRKGATEKEEVLQRIVVPRLLPKTGVHEKGLELELVESCHRGRKTRTSFLSIRLLAERAISTGKQTTETRSRPRERKEGKKSFLPHRQYDKM